MARKKIDPALLAEWEEGRRMLAERVEWGLARMRERKEREERRRQRLRRLTFGLLGRPY